MATYKSETVELGYSAEKVFDKLSNLQGLGELIKNIPEDKVPADQRVMLEQVAVTPDSISFPAGPVGSITLQLMETVRPTLIKLEGQGTPVPLGLSMHIIPLGEDRCQAYVQVDIQIPAMLKPMVSGPLQKMVDQFSQMLRQLPI